MEEEVSDIVDIEATFNVSNMAGIFDSSRDFDGR